MELNLCEILKGHEGESFYNAISGSYIKLTSINGGIVFSGAFFFNEDGSYIKGGECMLFPSKNQRDWNKWDKENNHKIPKTWSDIEDYIGFNNANDYCIDVTGNFTRRNTPIEKSALALLKIHQLIEVSYGGNVPTNRYNGIHGCFHIRYDIIKKGFVIYHNKITKQVIAFHTEEQAEEFLSYPENVQLLKDYFMV